MKKILNYYLRKENRKSQQKLKFYKKKFQKRNPNKKLSQKF